MSRKCNSTYMLNNKDKLHAFTHLQWIARLWMGPCSGRERDEGIRSWKMGSREDKVNKTEQSKTMEKKPPAKKVSGTNGEKILKLFMPRGALYLIME